MVCCLEDSPLGYVIPEVSPYPDEIICCSHSLIDGHDHLTFISLLFDVRLLLSYRVGMIEWIQNTKPLKDVLRDTMTKAENDHYGGR